MCLVSGDAGALLLEMYPAQTNRPLLGRLELHHLLFDVLKLKDGPATGGSARFSQSGCAHARFDRGRGWAPSATEPQWPRINRIFCQCRCPSRGHHWGIRPADGVVIAFAARVTTPLRSLVTRAAYRRGIVRARVALARTRAGNSLALGDLGALAAPILSRLAVLARQTPQVACRSAPAFGSLDYRSACLLCRLAPRLLCCHGGCALIGRPTVSVGAHSTTTTTTTICEL
jgi:hypothetical protein